MIARALNALGLMRVSEHEEYAELAAQSIVQHHAAAAQAEEIAVLREEDGMQVKMIDDLQRAIKRQHAEILSLRPDALLWRAARQKRADRKVK